MADDTHALSAAERFAERERADDRRLPPRWTTAARTLDAFLSAYAGLAACWLGYLLLRDGVHANWQASLLVVFYAIFILLVLPRMHRVLTDLYIPSYFLGRARTSDGLLGDPVNLALRAHEAQIHCVMAAAGWTRADDLTIDAGRHIVSATVTGRSYPRAPVSSLYLFERAQDFAYQQEIDGNPAKRHHVRFWRCPAGWTLPGGQSADWLGAATYDRSVGLSLFTLQVTHKIAANTDIERDFVVATVASANPAARTSTIKSFSVRYHSRNGGGDLIETDGALPMLDLRLVVTEPLPAGRIADSRKKRPAQTSFGAAVAFLRGIGHLILAAVAVAGLLALQGAAAPPESGRARALAQLLAVSALYAVASGLVEIVLAVATYRGRNWARIVLTLFYSVITTTAFAGQVDGNHVMTLLGLPGVAAGILVMLALSSRRSRDYAHQHRKSVAEAQGNSSS